MKKPCDMDCFHCAHPDCINDDFGEIHESERHNTNSMIRAKRLKSAGLCVRCGKRPLHTGWVCKECAARMAELMTARRTARAEQGLCPRCGKVPLDPRYKICAECREYFKRHNQDSRERRRIEQEGRQALG